MLPSLARVNVAVALSMALLGLEVSGTAMKNHKMKQMSDKKYQRLTALSTLEGFKAELEPILIERAPDTDGSRCVRNHIIKRMSELGWTVEEDSFKDKTPHGVKNFTNVIAILNPSARRQLVMACHYDSKYFPDTGHGKFVGATDSAVPCALLIDLARSLNYSLWNGPGGEAEDITLQFVFFDGEEAFETWTATDSLYGSRHLAEKWRSQPHSTDSGKTVLDGMDLFVLLDLIGAPNPQFHDWFSETSHMFSNMRRIEKRLFQLGLLKEKIPSYFSEKRLMGGNGIDDDHIPFLRNGVPILHLITYPFPEVWHRLSDNESALDYDSIDDIAKILRIFVSEYLHLSM